MGVTRRDALAAGAAGAASLAWPAALRAGVRPFAMVGVSWRSPVRARIELRVRLGGGPWSPWAMASAGGHAGDGAGGLSGEPVWVGRADQVQLRGTRGVAGVRVHTVAAGATSVTPVSSSAAALPLAQPILPAGSGQPPIIARSAWAHGRARPRAGPFYGAIRLAFVHHTDNPNGYARDDVPALLQAMFHYHRDIRGYFDIAYNFIVDAFGRIWEGRAGGIDAPVLGAHAGGYNGVSTGIAVLGTFMDALPSPAALQAVERLLAWKLALHGVPAQGRVRVQVNPAEASYTPFRPGQEVWLPRVAGHRDGDSTDCPGDAFYHRLPALRPRVAALAGPLSALTISPESAVVSPGAPLTLSGRLTHAGSPLAGALIALQALAPRRVLARTTTDTDGRWSAAVVPEGNLVLRAVSAAAPAVVSEVAEIGVAPVLTLTLLSAYPPRVTGTVTPPKAKVTIDVYRDLLQRQRISTTVVRVRHGRFRAAPKLGVGVFTVIARTAADARNAAGASAPLRITR